MGYVGTAPLSGDYRKLDDISGSFNGSTTDFTLQVGSANVTPPKETTMLISVGGILQEPVSAYTVSGSTISFTSAPASGADFFGVLLGDTLDIGTPADDTVGVAQIVDTLISGQTEITSGLAAADELLYSDGGTIKKVGLDNFIELAPTLATEDAVANGDYILFLDGGASGNMNKEAVHDLATLFAGTGLTATNSVIAVDASQTGITSVGALNAGSITSGFTSIDVGSGAISTTGAVATGALTATGNIIIPNAGTIGSASDTDALAIAAGGVVNFTQAPTVASAAIKTAGTETIWVPATSMVVSVNAPSAGLASIYSVSVNTTIPVLDFDGGSSDEVATFNIAFPKSWNAGTVTARFFWTNSNANAGNVVWGLQGICVVDSGALNGAMSDAGEVIQDANITTSGDVMVTSSTPAITINGVADDGVTFFNVFRDASDTTNDTYASDARLIGVQVFFTTDAANDA